MTNAYKELRERLQYEDVYKSPERAEATMAEALHAIEALIDENKRLLEYLKRTMGYAVAYAEETILLFDDVIADDLAALGGATMTDDLIKRLQDWVPAEAPPEGRTAPDAVADMRQAANRIEALTAEVERLREALRVYAGPLEWTQEGGWGMFPVWADGYPGGVYIDDDTLDFGDAARAALEKQP